MRVGDRMGADKAIKKVGWEMLPTCPPKKTIVLFPFLLFLTSFIVVIPASCAERDWEAVEKEVAELLSQLIQVDTTNPPGNEITAANFWKQRLVREGLEAQVFESQPGRGVVYARLKGSGEKKALILLHHLDGVPAVRADWEV